jgi:hypothetical protein
MFVFNILVSFQFVQITFIYFPYLFSIRNPGPHCFQINEQNAYDLRFGCSLYAWKDNEIIFLTQPVSLSTKIGVPTIVKTKSFSSVHRNAIFHFHKMSSLASACTHRHKIILFHNTLMINLSITYIFFPCLCLISFFLSHLFISCLFIYHICFQFGV